jgi:hypothetical protein
MGKTFRRDSRFRPKKHGRIFTKDEVWKKNKSPKQSENPPPEIEIKISDYDGIDT